jgi:hypothetical protein
VGRGAITRYGKKVEFRFALKKLCKYGGKVKEGQERAKKELSQVLGPPHHELPIAGSTRRSLGKVGRLFPNLIYRSWSKKLHVFSIFLTGID